MFKIAICDDEKMMCDILYKKLCNILKQWYVPFSIQCYTSALELLESNLSFDLMLLDIQMPDLNGIELAKKIRQQSEKCQLIFVTILKEYVLCGFELDAADYIYKPIDENRFQAALKRVLQKWYSQNIIVQIKNEYQIISFCDIYYIEVLNRKIYIHTKKNTIQYYASLQQIQKQLDTRFVKCHRSYIINIDYLKQYQPLQLILENGEIIPVSRLRKKQFLEYIKHYIQKEG